MAFDYDKYASSGEYFKFEEVVPPHMWQRRIP